MKETLIQEFEETTFDLGKVLSSFSQDEFNKIPFEGSWTAGQVAEHLFKSESNIPKVLTGNSKETATDPYEKTGLIRSIFLDYSKKMKSPEFIGGFLIITGLLTRFASIALLINMLVATLLVGFKNFFLGGAAYPCLLFVIFLVFVLTGPLAYSIDAALSTKNEKHRINHNFSTAF